MSQDPGGHRRVPKAEASRSPAIDVLRRWEDHGAWWRLRSSTGEEAVVDLLSCTGELMDQLRSTDAEVLAYLARRPSSQDD